MSRRMRMKYVVRMFFASWAGCGIFQASRKVHGTEGNGRNLLLLIFDFINTNCCCVLPNQS